MPKNIVICCDGTGNEIEKSLSNVMKLYRCIDTTADQTVFYDPGIGTIGVEDEWSQTGQHLKELFSMATGAGLYKNIIDSYTFLSRTYEPGDNIYMFGFSRGAYTVRALGGLINLVGLLPAEQSNLASYALKAYKDASSMDDLSIGRRFGHVTKAIHPPIKFMGVWDTVNSVIVPNGRSHLFQLEFEKLPYSLQNPSVEVFRQALSIDEKRRMFRPKMWKDENPVFQIPFSDDKPRPQDAKQVWFAGDHSDIGGGYPEEESGLAKLALKWMIDQAEKAGLRLDHRMVDHIVCGEDEPGGHSYCTEDPLAPLHNSLSAAWKSIEWLPRSVHHREWPARKSFLGYYIPAGEPRHIPDKALIHASVFERMTRDPSYRPVNLPKHYRIEGEADREVTCALPAPNTARHGRRKLEIQ